MLMFATRVYIANGEVRNSKENPNGMGFVSPVFARLTKSHQLHLHAVFSTCGVYVIVSNLLIAHYYLKATLCLTSVSLGPSSQGPAEDSIYQAYWNIKK